MLVSRYIVPTVENGPELNVKASRMVHSELTKQYSRRPYSTVKSSIEALVILMLHIFAEQAFIVEKFTFAGNDILLDEQFNTEILNVPLLFRTDVDTVMVFPIILNKEAFDIFAVELFKLDTLTVVVFIVVGLNVDVVNVDTDKLETDKLEK